ncbi:MAG: aminotransferase class I/II-fold pyridoxal phosphate-dependent enzyme [Gammaproteobacteria bacterium]
MLINAETCVESISENKKETRNRDLVNNSNKSRALYSLYEWLQESSHIEITGRIFQGLPHREVTAKYSSLNADYNNLIHLGSYNYSGLNGHPEIIKSAKMALDKYGITTSGVRLLNGTSDLHVQLEKQLANFLGFEDCVTYSSGYAANISVLNTICSEKDIVFSDELNHQSLIDGLKLSGATIIKFPHKDYVALEASLKTYPIIQRKHIITDGIFSMDGDIADLTSLAALANKYNTFLVVDDAHATAALGPYGRGTPAHFNIEDEIDILTGSLSKGLPGVGGFAACSKKTAQLLRYGSNGYIFSASVPVPVIAGLLTAISILQENPEIQEKLHKNEVLLRDGIRDIGLNVLHSETPIIPIVLTNRDIAFQLAKCLHENGIYANPICFPAVSRHHPRLRLNASASLTEKDIDYTLITLRKIATKLKIINKDIT